jgi:hypothetical protein
MLGLPGEVRNGWQHLPVGFRQEFRVLFAGGKGRDVASF